MHHTCLIQVMVISAHQCPLLSFVVLSSFSSSWWILKNSFTERLLAQAGAENRGFRGSYCGRAMSFRFSSKTACTAESYITILYKQHSIEEPWRAKEATANFHSTTPLRLPSTLLYGSQKYVSVWKWILRIGAAASSWRPRMGTGAKPEKDQSSRLEFRWDLNQSSYELSIS